MASRSRIPRPGAALTALLLGACVLSLADVAAVRRLELLPAAVLAPLDRALGARVPGPVGEPPGGSDRAVATGVYDAYRAAVVGATPGGVLAPVVARDRAAGELVVRVPAGAVEPGAAASQRGALLGLVEAVDGELATVRVLGHPRLRPVAGEWRAGDEAPPVFFLAAGDGNGLALESRSVPLRPPLGQLAYTRDVAALGGRVPGGLLLGRLVPGAEEAPGGARPGDLEAELRVEPLLDPWSLHALAVEARDPRAPAPEARAIPTRLRRATRRAGDWILAAGRADGVRAGDWVAQDGVLVGTVRVAGPHASTVRPGLGPGVVLVVSADGAVTPATPARAGWPGRWRPDEGDLVVAGRPASGGLVAGHIAALDEEGFSVTRARVDFARPVTVLGP